LLLVVAGGITDPLGLGAILLAPDTIGTLAEDKGTEEELDHATTDEGVADTTDAIIYKELGAIKAVDKV
jgi:hypothetical protein